MQKVQHSTTGVMPTASVSALDDSEDSRRTTDQIGPRTPGTVYYDGPRLVEVRAVVTDPSEARRILRRHSARFAVLVRDLHAGTEHYTGAVWTGSDRVLKAVA